MALEIEARHDLSPDEIDAIEDRLYDHNSAATARRDAEGLGFVIRDDTGRIVAAAAAMSLIDPHLFEF